MDITSIIVAILSSSLLSSLLAFVFEMIRARRDTKSNSAKADRLILLYVIKASGKAYLEANEVSAIELSAFNDTYKCYKDLGGDGYADTIHEKVNNLNVIV